MSGLEMEPPPALPRAHARAPPRAWGGKALPFEMTRAGDRRGGRVAAPAGRAQQERARQRAQTRQRDAVHSGVSRV